ncbi:hypothetical protein [Saccharothrix sp. ALI-22-I]|uniref:hypothetical protein n=1 Tax=Saccharothrix sp. ALI-22-I TaxID=1933778 RepID=UPI00117B8EC4|nr:hypothetical protein [Saccharothrix sp. ALI-22-I]
MVTDNCSAERLVAEFDAPADVAAAIVAWDDEFQAVYNRSDPESSGFPDEAATAAWHDRGERLAEQLAAALRGADRVPYRSGGPCVRRLRSAPVAAVHTAVCGAKLEQAVELNDLRRRSTASNGGERHRLTWWFSVCAGQGTDWSGLAV